jgi:mxaA protein
MNNFVSKFIVLAGLVLLADAAVAEPSAARIVKLVNPIQSTGIRIGDIMERSVVLEAPVPYQLSRSALPMKGSNRDGIELADLQIEKRDTDQANRYIVTLRYQIFGHAHAPAVMLLPEETFALTGGPQGLSLKIPAWRFWYSPLAVADITTAKGNLQPQFRPSIIDTETHRARLFGFLALLAISTLALAYYNADSRWLPFMNGPFAQAHRRIKRLPSKDGQAWKTALTTLHEAFNRVHGRNLFAADIDAFAEKHPQFARAHADIEAFFAHSGRALFSDPPQDADAFVKEVAAFSKRLRDCERGAA